MAVTVFTGLLAYHVFQSPLGGVFARLIPTPVRVATEVGDPESAKVLVGAEVPEIDPGAKVFQKAHELLAVGKLAEARAKLITLVNIFPASSAAPVARRIVGEMNLDDLLSSTHMEGKITYAVKRGDSFVAIAARHKTTIECLMSLNSMMELKGIQPGEELVVLPLDFRVLVEAHRKVLSLWDGGRFLREYPILHLGAAVGHDLPRTTISSKAAEHDGKRVQPQGKEYRAAGKVIQLAKSSVLIRGWDGTGDKPVGAILVESQDMEELSLLTRVGNEVEFR